MGTPMLLEGSGPLAVRRDEGTGRPLIDALPYADPLDTASRATAEALVQEEMKRGGAKKPGEYLAELPAAAEYRLAGAPLVRAELERVGRGEALAPLDTQRYRLDPPRGAAAEDPAAWRAALANAKAQLEHQHLRILNLELLLKYGPDLWKVENRGLEQAGALYAAAAAEADKEAGAVNRERKLQQLAAGGDIQRLEYEWYQQVSKNMDIDLACRQLEAALAARGAGAEGAAGGGEGGEGEGAPGGG